MTELASVDSYLNDLLDTAAFERGDVGVNGIQVPTQKPVRKVVLAVSATRPVLERAIAENAELVLVHHGLFWTFDRGAPDAITLERLRLLHQNDIGLIAQHLPLDAHPEHGNNALLCAALGADDHTPYDLEDGTPVGRVARFDGDGIAADALAARTHEVTGRAPLRLGAGPERVKTAAIVSGSAADEAARAASLGCDLLLTGEPRERTQAVARESAITVLAAGHHATETLGVRRLGELLQTEFGIEPVWVDDPNPV